MKWLIALAIVEVLAVIFAWSLCAASARGDKFISKVLRERAR